MNVDTLLSLGVNHHNVVNQDARIHYIHEFFYVYNLIVVGVLIKSIIYLHCIIYSIIFMFIYTYSQ